MCFNTIQAYLKCLKDVTLGSGSGLGIHETPKQVQHDNFCVL
jgi:hypothetical protein